MPTTETRVEENRVVTVICHRCNRGNVKASLVTIIITVFGDNRIKSSAVWCCPHCGLQNSKTIGRQLVVAYGHAGCKVVRCDGTDITPLHPEKWDRSLPPLTTDDLLDFLLAMECLDDLASSP